MAKLLLIEKDAGLKGSIVNFLSSKGIHPFLASNTEEGLKILESKAVEVIVADTDIGDSGIKKFKSILNERNLNSQMIIMSDVEKLAMAVKMIDEGGHDFIRKPVNLEELELKVRRAVDMRRLRMEKESLRGSQKLIHKTQDFIWASPEMEKVLKLVDKIAKSDSSVLLLGETGTGKELVSGAIHHNSLRAENAFIRVNCAALPDELLESELFGHVRGAFTGAEKTRIGRFEQADGGTIFLDEIGDMSLKTQAKVLRVLQEKQFERVGANRTIETDVRLISATNKDLAEEIENGNFREDLYYRLNTIQIDVPPLRERKEDIVPLSTFFLKRYAGKNQKRIKEIAPSAIQRLVDYNWPGNIRELENVIERAVLLADDSITEEDLNLNMSRRAKVNLSDKTTIELPPGGISLEEVERELILEALKRSDWNQKTAAEFLRLSRRALNYKIGKHGITSPKWRINR